MGLDFVNLGMDLPDERFGESVGLSVKDQIEDITLLLCEYWFLEVLGCDGEEFLG